MIKTLTKSIREYKWPALLSPLCMVGEVFMETKIPRVLSQIVDLGVTPGNMDAVLRGGLTLVLFSLLSLCFGVASAYFAAAAGTGFAKNLRHDMFYRVQTFDFANIDKFSTASIITRITSDVASLQMCFQMLIRMAIRCPMMLILAATNAFSISPRLCLVYTIALPLLGVGLFILIHLVKNIFERAFKTLDRLNNVTQENLHGIRVVKSFVRADKENRKFAEVSSDIYRDFSKAEKLIAINNPLMQLTVYTCIIVISYLGATMVVNSGNNAAYGLTTGQLTAMFTYTGQILSSLMMLSMVFVMLTMSRAPVKRACQILTETPRLQNPETPVTEVPDGSIDFEDVSFRYAETAKRNSLEKVSIHIDSGMTVGILGGTGAGKTTLVQLIPRLYDVTEGSLKVGGIDVRSYDISALRNAVSMVLQKNELFSGTVKDNLRWGDPNATEADMIHACQLACAHDFICALPQGYDTLISRGGKNVSGGQKQRLCIARALLKKPKILILDDSTSAVDTQTDARIRNAFAQQLPNTTKLIIAQRVASVQDADLILVMDGGQIVASGKHETLLQTCQIYQEVYESQIKGVE